MDMTPTADRVDATRMETPPMVSPEEWETARAELLVKEKELTRARDVLAARRRRLPWVRVDKDYAFEGPGGRRNLLDLFDGRRQLIVYRFFFEPGVARWPEAGCGGCSMFVDNLAHLAHLHARDTSLVLVSRAPQADIERFRQRMGWTVPWFTTLDDFSEDFGVAEHFGLNVFIRNRDRVFRTYFTNARAADAIGNVWSLLDITPLGRQEQWEDSPEGYPQDPAYSWWSLHDEYDPPTATSRRPDPRRPPGRREEAYVPKHTRAARTPARVSDDWSMRVLFSSTSGFGHVQPMLPLAAAARDRGHEVLWATADDVRPRVEAAGIPTASGGDARRRGVARVPPSLSRVALPHRRGTA